MEFITGAGQAIDKKALVAYDGAFLIGVYQEGEKQHYQSLGRIIVNGSFVLLRITKEGKTETELYVEYPMYPNKQDLRFAIDRV